MTVLWDAAAYTGQTRSLLLNVASLFPTVRTRRHPPADRVTGELLPTFEGARLRESIRLTGISFAPNSSRLMIPCRQECPWNVVAEKKKLLPPVPPPPIIPPDQQPLGAGGKGGSVWGCCTTPNEIIRTPRKGTVSDRFPSFFSLLPVHRTLTKKIKNLSAVRQNRVRAEASDIH